MSEDDNKTDLKVVRLDVKPSELAASLSEYRNNIPHLIEYNKICAELWFKKFQALKEEGFTASEALQLCSK